MHTPAATRSLEGPLAAADIASWLTQACGDIDVVIQIADGRDVFLEARGKARTCAASLQLGGDGTVRRRLLISCPLVDPPPPWEPGQRPQLHPLLTRYFEALNSGRFADAAECFAEDCVYIHPPYRPGEPQAIFKGRAELAEGWRLERGSGRVEMRIDRCVQDGNHGFVEGVAAGGSFLASAVLARGGLISRYVAFYTPQLVARVAPEELANVEGDPHNG